MNIPKLQTTTDYKIFKKIDSNRDIERSHLNRLIRGIEGKNLLYLFPIVVNKSMEIVDGQHRLKAAEELKLPIFYIVDNNITKADIAMVNSNRKSWSMRNYIEFYARDGRREFKRLKELIDCGFTRSVAARLMDAVSVRYTDGGGKFSRGIKSGILNDDHYVMAKEIGELCRKLFNDRDYAFDPFFVMDIKNAIIQSGALSGTAADKIYSKRSVLPTAMEKGDTYLGLLKEILGITSQRPYSSAREVEAYLEQHKTKRVA